MDDSAAAARKLPSNTPKKTKVSFETEVKKMARYYDSWALVQQYLRGENATLNAAVVALTESSNGIGSSRTLRQGDSYIETELRSAEGENEFPNSFLMS
jgi:hypothetical protein